MVCFTEAWISFVVVSNAGTLMMLLNLVASSWNPFRVSSCAADLRFTLEQAANKPASSKNGMALKNMTYRLLTNLGHSS